MLTSEAASAPDDGRATRDEDRPTHSLCDWYLLIMSIRTHKRASQCEMHRFHRDVKQSIIGRGTRQRGEKDFEEHKILTIEGGEGRR